MASVRSPITETLHRPAIWLELGCTPQDKVACRVIAAQIATQYTQLRHRTKAIFLPHVSPIKLQHATSCMSKSPTYMFFLDNNGSPPPCLQASTFLMQQCRYDSQTSRVQYSPTGVAALSDASTRSGRPPVDHMRQGHGRGKVHPSPGLLHCPICSRCSPSVMRRHVRAGGAGRRRRRQGRWRQLRCGCAIGGSLRGGRGRQGGLRGNGRPAAAEVERGGVRGVEEADVGRRPPVLPLLARSPQVAPAFQQMLFAHVVHRLGQTLRLQDFTTVQQLLR